MTLYELMCILSNKMVNIDLIDVSHPSELWESNYRIFSGKYEKIPEKFLDLYVDSLHINGENSISVDVVL